MANKVICFIATGISGIILLLYLMTTFMAEGSDGIALLILLAMIFPFLILGLIAGLIIDKKRILSVIFMIISSIATILLGLMCLTGGLSYLGIFALPLSIIDFILYITAAIITLAKK